MNDNAPNSSQDAAKPTDAARGVSTGALGPDAHRLLASISHAIRTPLSGIIGAVSLLQESEVSDDGKRHLRLLRSSANSLLFLMSDVLDLFRLESGELHPRISTTTPRKIMDDVVRSLRTQAERLGVNVVVDDAGLDQQPIRTDGKRIGRAMSCIARELMRSSGGKGLSIRAELNKDDELGSYFQCDVEIGLNQDKVFHGIGAFSEDASEPMRGDGALEVWLSARLIELLGGRGAEREVSTGNGRMWRVEFKVPLGEVAPEESQAHVALEGSVVVVMQRSPSLTSVEDAARKLGLEVHVATSGQDALRILLGSFAHRTGPLSLIVDEELGDMSGTAFVEVVRQIPDLAEIDVTGIGSGISGRLCCRIEKPVRQQHLQDALIACAKRSAEADKQVSAEQRVEPRDTRVLSREAQGEDERSSQRVLVAEDHPVNRMIVREMVSRLGYTVDEAVNGREAVEMALNGKYALVFMDFEMPELDGIEATKLIREGVGANAEVPIVALSGHAFDSDRDAFLEAGMNDHLPKPVTPLALRAILDRWTDGKATVRVPESASRNREEPKQRRARVRSEEIQQNDEARESRVLDREFLGAFEKTTSRSVVTKSLKSFIEYAEEDVKQLLDAISRKDTAALLNGAQRLGGAAASIGASELRETCKRLADTAMKDQQALFGGALDQVRAGLRTLENGLKEAGYLSD